MTHSEWDERDAREFVYVREGGCVHAFGIDYRHPKLRAFVGERVMVVREPFFFACEVLVFRADVRTWAGWITNATNKFRQERMIAALFQETEEV